MRARIPRPAAEALPQRPPEDFAQLAPLPRSFYARDPRTVARELLGKLLIRRLTPAQSGTRLLVGRIVEVEAYLGSGDPAAHAFRGRTARNAVLFGPPGHAYVYFIYGNHDCTNISCQPEGEAGCVLLRALEPLCGLQVMAALRGVTLGRVEPGRPATLAQLRRLTSGPGCLSQALGIRHAMHNGCDLCSASSDLFIAAEENRAGANSGGGDGRAILATPRINVPRAPEPLWRYVLVGNPFVSGRKISGLDCADSGR
jgi:DNA-3-methyladenine glycosylase